MGWTRGFNTYGSQERSAVGEREYEPDQGSSPSSTLTGKDTSELVLDLLVGSKQESDLSSSNPDVSSGNISVGADVTGELGHEGVAESSDLGVGSTLGVELHMTADAELGVVLGATLYYCARKRDDKGDGRTSDPPFPPPMLSPVRAFLKICSKPRL